MFPKSMVVVFLRDVFVLSLANNAKNSDFYAYLKYPS